jgi:ribosomal protein S18 acetylase RimI-like enzyme
MFKILPFSQVHKVLSESLFLQSTIPTLVSEYRNTPFTIQDAISEWKGNGSIILVRNHTELLGIARLDRHRTFWELSSFIVNPHCRGCKVGSNILDSIHLPIMLKVKQENDHAIRLYTKYGFKIDSYCEGRYIMKNSVC